MSRKIFIYGLKDPRDGKIKYVGQTVNMTARMATHCNTASSPKTSKGRWIMDINASGLSVIPVVLQVVSECAASDCEAKWIKYYAKRGKLFNCRRNTPFTRTRTNDGKSIVTIKLTPEERSTVGTAAKITGDSLCRFAAVATVAKARAIISNASHQYTR